MGRALPEDPWDELIHQGDVFEESVRATPAIVAALERGTDDDANWLYLLAALCVGRPESRAERIRAAARAGTPTFRRLLGADAAGVRAGAVGALAGAEAVADDDVRRLRALTREDPDTTVRGAATLALGLVEEDVTELLDAEEPEVRYAAALARHRAGDTAPAVVRVVAETVADWGPEEIAGLPPWDDLYPDALDILLGLAPEDAHPALTLFSERLPKLDKVAAAAAVEVLLRFADDDLRRQTAESLVANDAAWERAIEYEHLLPEHGLPPTRDELRAFLDR